MIERRGGPDIGYVLPTRGTVLSDKDPQATIVERAATAASLGYDAAWVGDSVTAKPRLEPLTTLSAVATATDEIRLGTAIYLPHLRRPIHVAHQLATVDRLSDGRLSIGVGVGSGRNGRKEHKHAGVPFEKRGRLLNETLNVVWLLLEGDEISYDGELYSIENASLGFRPQSPIPVYVASAAFDPGKGFPKSIRERLIAYADGWLPIAKPPEMYRSGLDAARELAKTDLVGAYYIDIVIDESEAAALEQAQRYLAAYYPEWGELDFETIRNRGAFGPAEHVASQLEAYIDAGVEEFVIRFPTEEQDKQLEAFSRLD